MPLCPKCSSEVAASDTHCMDCGENLVQAREKERSVLREMSQAARTGGGAPVGPANAAAAGALAVGEKSSEETRIRAFDRQEAERLAEERKTSWVTSGLSFVLALVLVGIGLNRFKEGGGFGSALDGFKPAALRDGSIADAAVIGSLLLGTGLCALMVAIGQARLARATNRAITQVKLNIKPDIVRVSAFTVIGLFASCIFCPPVGLIIGLLFRFGRNPDLTGLGANMVLVSIGIMVLFGGNMLWKLAENFQATQAKPPAARAQ